MSGQPFITYKYPRYWHFDREILKTFPQVLDRCHRQMDRSSGMDSSLPCILCFKHLTQASQVKYGQHCLNRKQGHTEIP